MEIAITLVQFDIAQGDPIKNLERMDHFVRQAKKQGAELVVFPEDAVCGPLSGQFDFVAFAPEYLAHFQSLAVRHAIDIVPGTWTVAENGLLYNQAHYINADGSLAGTYRKINLWDRKSSTSRPALSLRFSQRASAVSGSSSAGTFLSLPCSRRWSRKVWSW